MSDGKYLINKSSLTGIADAVRDKLGTGGKATTDPQTGDIIYPKGKGYYIDSVTTTFIEVPDNSEYHIYPGSQVKTFIRFDTKNDYLTKVEKPVSEIEVEGIFGTTATGRRFKRYIVINSNSFQLDDSNQTNIQNFKQTFDTPQTYLSISISVTNDYTREKTISWSNVKIYLRDENGNLIDLITSGFPSQGCTIGTTTSQIQKPIPYSVADIKNNIKDYWNIPDGSLNISANGTYDVTNKAEAVVNVPNPSTGSLEITENGTYDVTDKASAVVNVPTGGGGGSAKIPDWGFFYQDGTKYVKWDSDSIATPQEILSIITDVRTQDGAVMARKSDGSFISYKELGWANPVTDPSSVGPGLTAQQINDAYENDRILVMQRNNSSLPNMKNQFYLVVSGIYVCWCYRGGGQNSGGRAYFRKYVN